MKKNILITFQIAAVFIGTLVGAGLASGQEITQFFTTYGYKSFIGIILCCIIYITLGYIVIHISIKHKLNSYNEFIKTVSPGVFGRITDLLTSAFLVSGSAIIMAGSGALLHQYFGVSKWVGILLMAAASLVTLLRDTKGLIEVNSIIVPSLIAVISTIFILYLMFNKDIVSASHIKTIPHYKSFWLFSSLLYAGFNMLCCTGVLVPLSKELNRKKAVVAGISVGAVGLTLLCLIINLLLMLNVPYIFKYEIPLLYIANRFGPLMQIILLCIIWCEMFSTEVSNVYSIAKTMEHALNISYKKSIIIILAAAIPVSQIGFVNLISVLYPSFGVISLVFIVQCVIFYIRNK